jgi:integrase
MAREKLGDDPAKYVKTKGNHADGKGLYLRVAAPGQGSWVARFLDPKTGKRRDMSLGPFDIVTADEARATHLAAWKVHKAGGDPFAVIAKAINAGAGEAAQTPAGTEQDHQAAPDGVTPMRFADVLEEVIALNSRGKEPVWKGGLEGGEVVKYRKLAGGPLDAMWVHAIGVSDVEKALEKWTSVNSLSSADKYRIRIKLIFDYARAKRYRGKDAVNPANKEDFKYLIPAAPKVVHRKPMPSAELPGFMAELLRDRSEEARALAFLILTNVRTAEARDGLWEEIDIGNMAWTLPPERHKEGKWNGEHKVALTPAMLAVLGEPKKAGRIFPNLKDDEMLDLLHTMRPGRGFHVHGLRTTFKGDWALKAGYPLDFREMALAHKIGDATAQAYNLPVSELYTLLIPMRQGWCDFAMSKAALADGRSSKTSDQAEETPEPHEHDAAAWSKHREAQRQAYRQP